MKRALVAFNMEYVHLGKDVFLFPYYICRKYNYALDFVTVDSEKNKDLPNTHRGANIIKIENPQNKNADSLLTDFIKDHAKEYDLLVLFHYRALTVLRAHSFKKRNPYGKVYVKMDMGIGTWKENFEVRGLRKLRSKIQLSLLKKYCDFCSVESSAIYNNMLSVWRKQTEKTCALELLPNGFDEEEFESTGLKVKSYGEKQNFLITAGRLGSYPKNTGFLLCFLDKLNLRDWKVKLIGPYTDEVLEQYKEICAHNESFSEKVELTGNVTDKKLLFSYYNDAKIFVLPSIWESFGLVLTEAMRFGNYIITSPTISANDLTDCGRTGSIVPLEEELWVKEIQSLIDDERKIRESYPKIIQLSENKFRMKEIIENAKCFEVLGEGR